MNSLTPHIIDGRQGERADAPHFIQEPEPLRSTISRRNVLNMGMLGLCSLAIGDQLITKEKWPREQTTIKVYETNGAPNGDLWLVLGGLGVVDSDKIVQALAPTFQSAQYVASVYYSDQGIRIPDIIEEVNRASFRLGGFNNVHIYGHSMGGTMIEDVRRGLDPQMGRGVNAHDCTPLTTDYIADEFLVKALDILPIPGTFSGKLTAQISDRMFREHKEGLTPAEKWEVIWRLTNDKAAPPTVFDQLHYLASRTMSYWEQIPEETPMWYICPWDLGSDRTTLLGKVVPVFMDDLPGQKRLIQAQFRGHADPGGYPDAYNRAIGQVVYDSEGLVATKYRGRLKPLDP